MSFCNHAKPITGVVLAGGKSSRMGTDKAALSWHGHPLLDHMMDKLEEAGIESRWVSGNRHNYPCFNDPTPFSGPGCAIASILRRIPEDSYGLLAVPVDMPLLPVAALRMLIECPSGAFFSGQPLPAFFPNHTPAPDLDSVYKIHADLDTRELELPDEWQFYMQNINTPEQWERLIRLTMEVT
ncbi:molybdenum cofactor guanylyltransferase [Halorhodospira halochloris]|uniref:molybdenum cofactor guanylyltransferase n=1 Tax=Halorhodospira halochloris TaxID=1052 RepID=UPI001EE8D121|nr:molybdenum cofactor guanylyltransferase [Halorhodospira halochloris]MCG5529490.1 molybdenum cofactor guanylyltransferase [Halorhodospira halochloris]